MPEELKQTIFSIVSQLKESHIDLFEVCHQVLREKLNTKEISFIEVTQINKGTAFVKVKSPMVMFTLNFKKNAILKEIKSKTDKISDIKFNIGA